MRNLKKFFAVLLTVAMLASLMVPALAAFTYSEEAIKLQAIGVFAGGPDDLNLDEAVSRIQGLAFAIRSAGKDAEALAMTDAEADAILADWVDDAEITGWQRKYAAYAIENEITVGVSKEEKRLSSNEPITSTSLLVFIMRAGMGYSEAATVDVIDAAVEAGILTAAQAVAYRSAPDLIRDDAAGILFGAFTTGVNADGTKLIEAYIASGATTEAAATAAGFVEAAPTTLEAVKASATNLKEIVVTFNTEVDAASIAGNFAVGDKAIKSVRLNDDKVSVTIELHEGKAAEGEDAAIPASIMANQSEFKVTVKTGVKSAAGVALAEEVVLSGSVFDVTIPVALSAEHTGPNSFKVLFSEPVKADAGNYKVDGGTYFISKVESTDNGRGVQVTLYADIPNGEHKVAVTGAADYAGYKCVDTTLTFVAAKDEVAPGIAKVISASPEKVELEMTEGVTFVGVKDVDDLYAGVYHTNSTNKADKVTVTDGNKVTIEFTTNKLPNGTAYLTIVKELFQDAWGNKSAAIEDLALTVTVDRVKPTVKNVKAENDKQIVIEFSENIQDDVGKFILLDSTGKDITSDYTISKTYADAKVTLDFDKALAGSTFSVVIEGIKDLAGNEIDKVQPSVAVTDTTAPEVADFDADTVRGLGEIYKTKGVIKVKFNEVMNSADILNLANYQSNGIYLSTTKATATIADGGKAVLIDYSNVTEDISVLVISVGRVRDAAGNYIARFSTDVNLTDMDSNGIEIKNVAATGTKTLVVTLKDALTTFEPADFLISIADTAVKSDETAAAVNAKVTEVATGVNFANNADGEGVITFTLKAAYELNTSFAADAIKVSVITETDDVKIKSKNAFDVPLAEGFNMDAEDKIAATFTAAFKTITTTNDAIVISFSEAINRSTLSKATFTVEGNTVTEVIIDNTDTVTEMTLKLDKAITADKVKVTQAVNFEDTKKNVSSGLSADAKADAK